MSYDKRMKILSKLDSIDPAEALTAYPRIAEYDAITKLPICRRLGKNNMSMKRLQIFFGFNCRPNNKSVHCVVTNSGFAFA